MRSSNEWKVMTANLPPGTSNSTAIGRTASRTSSSWLTSIRRAWNVRVAGWILSRPCLTCVMIWASSPVVRMGRWATMARAIRRDCLSSPYCQMMSARSASGNELTRSAADGPSPERRMSNGPSCWKEKPRSALSSCREDTPRSKRIPSTRSKPFCVATVFSSEKLALTNVTREAKSARFRRAAASAPGSASTQSTRPSGAEAFRIALL